MNANRIVTRLEMFRDRGGQHRAKCDMCGERQAEHMHELINRGRTVNRPDAREASFQKELCSLLCAHCHEHAHNPDAREKLFHWNIKRYGYQRVFAAWTRFLQTTNGNDMGIVFPKETDHECA